MTPDGKPDQPSPRPLREHLARIAHELEDALGRRMHEQALEAVRASTPRYGVPAGDVRALGVRLDLDAATIQSMREDRPRWSPEDEDDLDAFDFHGLTVRARGPWHVVPHGAGGFGVKELPAAWVAFTGPREDVEARLAEKVVEALEMPGRVAGYVRFDWS